MKALLKLTFLTISHYLYIENVFQHYTLDPFGIDFLTSVGIGIGFLLKSRFSVGIGFGFGFKKSRRFFRVFSVFSWFFRYLFCFCLLHIGTLPVNRSTLLSRIDEFIRAKQLSKQKKSPKNSEK
jgi:hypothetical protein